MKKEATKKEIDTMFKKLENLENLYASIKRGKVDKILLETDENDKFTDQSMKIINHLRNKK